MKISMLNDHKKNDFTKMIIILIIFLNLTFLVLFTFNWKYDFSYNVFHTKIWQYFLAAFSGGALGLSGILLQKITKNSLSDISILGIGSFNVVCIIIYIFFSFDGTKDNLVEIKKYLPLVSISASILGTGLIYYLSQKNQTNMQHFIIVGIALQFLFEAINLFLLSYINQNNTSTSINHQINTEINNYAYGRFPNIEKWSLEPSWQIFNIISFFLIILILIFAYKFKKEIDLLEINEDLAKTNGVKIKLLKKALFFSIALLAGLESTLIGTIALLGIIAPQIAKMIFGNRSETNIIASFFIGAILVLFATFLSINLNQNLPIGILSTGLIIPFFMYLIFKNK